MRNQTSLFVAAFGLAAMLAGCATNAERYYWGHYETLLYVSAAEPGKIPLETQALTLEKDLRDADAHGKPVPPGFRAQLGYVYAQLGRADLAKQQFENEKLQYPESTTLMNRMLANLQAGHEKS